MANLIETIVPARDGELLALPGNSVLYSDAAWAVVRRSSGGEDKWFTDSGSHMDRSLTTAKLLEWVTDWTVMAPKRVPRIK